MVTKRLVKEHVLPCKRASFTTQKGIFYIAKGALLECKRRPIKNERVNSFTKKDYLRPLLSLYFNT